MVIVLDTVGP